MSTTAKRQDWMADVMRPVLLQALRRRHGNVSQAARDLCAPLRSFQTWVARVGLADEVAAMRREVAND